MLRNLHLTYIFIDPERLKRYKKDMTSVTLIAYIIGMLIVASLLMAWFYTTGPIHVLFILKRLGWQKDNEQLWEILGNEWEATWDTFINALAISTDALPDWLSALIQCKYCFSFHIAFWTSLAITVITQQHWLFVPAATFSWPVLAIIIMTHAQDRE